MAKKKKKNPNRVKAGKASKRKGSNFERTLANDLERRYGDLSLATLDRSFRRTPMSGGFRSEWPGDLVVPNWFPFAIEAKTVNDGVLDLTTLPLKGEDHQFLKWWDEELVKARRANKELMIVFSKGRLKPISILSMDILTRLDRHLAKGMTQEGTTVLTVRNPKYDLACVSYDALFSRLTKEQLTGLAQYLKEGDPLLVERQAAGETLLQEHLSAPEAG